MKFPFSFRKKPAETAVVPKNDHLSFFGRKQGDDPDDGEFNVLARSVQRGIDSFETVPSGLAAMDSLPAIAKKVGDGFAGTGIESIGNSLSPMVVGWFASQGFIGHQMCAIIAQQWLVGKACAMPAEDALRNGWNIDLQDADDGFEVEEVVKKIRAVDKRMKLDTVMFEAAKFCNVFGIRILIPIVESADKDYYRKPFNIDGITEGSFRGWTQIDPQWIYPLLDSVGAGDANSPNFYEPEYWVCGSVQYHRSHLVIMKTEEPADMLKPTYLFSGIPLPQRIAERVYAAERTANEAPLLAMSKRTTALKVDLSKVGFKKNAFLARIQEWINYRDNYSIKVLGKDEELTESDTSLADLDEVIMTQFQLVAAIAKVPATKLLGTSPKGFNATGDHEIKSYHEHLETIQSTWYDRFLERHYLLLSYSYFDKVVIEHSWLPVDSVGAEVEANIQKVKAETGQILIDSGVISPEEDRTRIRLDKDSGYSLAEEDEAPGKPEETDPNGADPAGGPTPPGIPTPEGDELLANAEAQAELQAAAVMTAVAAVMALEADKDLRCNARVVRLVKQLVERLEAPGKVGIIQAAEPTVTGAIGVQEFVEPADKSAPVEAVPNSNKPSVEPGAIGKVKANVEASTVPNKASILPTPPSSIKR